MDGQSQSKLSISTDFGEDETLRQQVQETPLDLAEDLGKNSSYKNYQYNRVTSYHT